MSEKVVADRKIIHVDMDAFYASVEQRDNPKLRGLPLAVGGGMERGVVAAASYEARTFGVRSAMSGRVAKRLCPDLVFVPPRFDRYKEISEEIRQIFYAYTDLVEPLSLDEAYLDVTENKFKNPSATLIAEELRKQIFEKTGLYASAGISINKFMAKIASDWNKPNGQKTIPPEEVLSFLEQLEIKKFYGVGRKTKERMYQLGIFTGADLKQKSEVFLTENFGKSGTHFYQVVRGIHTSEVKPERIPKSIGAERTFSQNLTSEIFLEEKLLQITAALDRRIRRHKGGGKTITLKIKYSDFTVQTRSKTFAHFISSQSLILEHSKDLLYQEKLKDSVRLIGVSLSNLKGSQATPTKETTVPLIEQLQFPF
ncbi:MAG: DNA polymerase IV [Flavobacteriaceae bacterium]